MCMNMIFSLCWLVGFYGISSLVGYLMQNIFPGFISLHPIKLFQVFFFTHIILFSFNHLFVHS